MLIAQVRIPNKMALVVEQNTVKKDSGFRQKKFTNGIPFIKGNGKHVVDKSVFKFLSVLCENFYLIKL